MKKLLIQLLVLVAAVSLAAGARAQGPLRPAPLAPPPSAAPTPEPAKPAAPKPAAAKPVHKRRPHPEGAQRPLVDPATALDKTLRLNGRDGELELARGDDKALKIVKLTLLGEVVSNPRQRCRIDIVADAPIVAVPQGEPDGLPRYAADIPACPLNFDVVEDGVLVPAQSNACVFSAADCQASPSGLWGPAASEIDAKAVAKARADADRSIQDSLRELEKHDDDAPASLAREQSDFAAERDDVCQAYETETRVGFCASRLAQTRAALLARRVAETATPSHPKRREKKTP